MKDFIPLFIASFVSSIVVGHLARRDMHKHKVEYYIHVWENGYLSGVKNGILCNVSTYTMDSIKANHDRDSLRVVEIISKTTTQPEPTEPPSQPNVPMDSPEQ